MTEHNFRNTAIKGVLWSAVDKGFVKVLQFIILVILARILSPTDFGLIGMLTIFISLSNLFIDSGFSQALVQNNKPTQSDYSTAFYFNIIVGIGLYAILFFSAPYIARYFNVPLLSSLLRVMSISLVTNSLTVVQRAKLLIRIDFKTLSIINILTSIISGVAGIWAAYKGYGVWALVIQVILSQVTMMILYWVCGKWHPSWTFSNTSFKHLFKFGSKLLAAGTVATIMNNVYNVVIGKLYKISDLGYYTRAKQMTDISSGTISEIINSVTFPLLSSIKEDNTRMINVYSRMLSMTAFITIPSMVLIAILAEPFVIVVLTPKWLPAVSLIQWLCLARMFTPISTLNMNILNAYGRSDLFMKVDLSKLPLTILIMAITLPISVEAVVIGEFIGTFICYFINAYLPGKLFNFGVRAQTKIFSKTLLATLGMIIVTIGSIFLIPSPIFQLIFGSLIGLISFIIFSAILKIEELKEIRSVIQRLFSH